MNIIQYADEAFRTDESKRYSFFGLPVEKTCSPTLYNVREIDKVSSHAPYCSYPYVGCTTLQGTDLNMAKARRLGQGVRALTRVETSSEEPSRPWSQSRACPSMPDQAKSSIANDSAIGVLCGIISLWSSFLRQPVPCCQFCCPTYFL